ncbi:hypothetical protein GGE31_001059 [Rhizobium cellulosilyticum]|nr:hypothetical protein [Rhizobium cellulosilyticum]MBB4410588.1 hypothetical protein [Rhizobium cellulosilyticum]
MTTTCIDELRAAMIREGCFTRRELRNFPWLSPNMTEQQTRVMECFGIGHPLKLRMLACGEIDDWNNTRFCGVPLCPRCFMRERRNQTRQAIRETFAGVANENLAFATILLSPTARLQNVRRLIESEKRRLVNFVARQRRKDARWNDFQMKGWWEMDRMSDGDYDSAGRNTKLALNALGYPLFVIGDADTTIWRPHLHTIIETGGIPLIDIAAALRAEGHSAPYQVDIRAFSTGRRVEHNLQNVIRYSLKFRVETGYKGGDAFSFIQHEDHIPGVRYWWKDSDISAYGEWLKGDDMAGFRSLRFFLGRKKIRNPASARAISTTAQPSVSAMPAVTDITDEISYGQTMSDDIDVDGLSSKKYSIGLDIRERTKTDRLRGGGYKGADVDGRSRNNKHLLDTNWICDCLPSVRDQHSCHSTGIS